MTNTNTKDNKTDKHVLHFQIEKTPFEWHSQYIKGGEVRKLGKIPKDHEIFLGIQRPWEDELVLDETLVDLARPGIEHFFSKKKGEHVLVSIFVNDNEIKISRGKHTVKEIKDLGGVPQSDILDELINGELTPLEDNAVVLIKGCEQFFSRVRGGVSS